MTVAGYVFALRRKPPVDADLYSSIYGADFEDDTMVGDVTVAAEAAAPMTAEEQALYGDDYGTEGESAEDDEYAEGEYDQEYYEGDDVALFPPMSGG